MIELGAVELMAGFPTDDNAAQAASRRFEELFQNLPIACLGFDRSGQIIEWNRACDRLFPAAQGSLMSFTIYELLCESDQIDLFHELVNTVFEDESSESFEWSLRQESNVMHLHCSMFPLHGAGGQVSGGILACLDLTNQKTYERQIEGQLLRLNEYSLEIEQSRWELEEANRRLAALAATDGLTGLLNHRAFQDALAKEVQRSVRERRPLSVVMIDVDRFKHFNDSFGHPEGDIVLKRVSNLLLSIARGSDTIARYGGEEFVAILPGADEASVETIAERMRSAIESEKWELRPVTASFGTSTLGPATGTPADIIAVADKALYRAKASGRNRVVVGSPSLLQAA